MESQVSDKDAQSLFRWLYKKRLLIDSHAESEITLKIVGAIIAGGLTNILACLLYFHLESELPHIVFFNISFTYVIVMPTFILFVASIGARVGWRWEKEHLKSNI